jgi:hypothetical protein
VSVPSWTKYHYGNENEQKECEREMHALAEYCSENIDEFFSAIATILSGEQRKGFTFGAALCSSISDHHLLIAKCLEAYSDIESPNAAVLCGILTAAKQSEPELFSETINMMFEDAAFHNIIPAVVSTTSSTYANVLKVFSLAVERKIEIAELGRFIHGGALSSLSAAEIIELTTMISRNGAEGVSIAIGIIYCRCFDHNEMFMECRSVIKLLVLDIDLMNSLHNYNQMDSYQWEQLVIKLLDSDIDKGFAIDITRRIFEVCLSDECSFSFEADICGILSRLISDHISEIWPTLAYYFENESPLAEMKIINLFGLNQVHGNNRLTLMEQIPVGILAEWCNQDLDRISYIICKTVPIIQEKHGISLVHPIIDAIIEKFGNSDQVLTNIASCIGPFSWSGSKVPYLKKAKTAIERYMDCGYILVERWASSVSDRLAKQIESEKVRDEEFSIGVY